MYLCSIILAHHIMPQMIMLGSEMIRIILPRKPLSIPPHKVTVGPRDTVVVHAASLLTSYPTAMNCWQLRAKGCTTLLRKDAVGHRDIRVALAVNFNA